MPWLVEDVGPHAQSPLGILALAVSFPFLTALPRLWLRARVEALNALAIAEIQVRQRKTQSDSKQGGTWLMLVDQAAEILVRGIEGDAGGRVSLAGALLATLSEVARLRRCLYRCPMHFDHTDLAGDGLASDVDDLVEARDQVGDQPFAGISRLGSQSRHQEVQRDGRDHEMSGRIHANGLGSSAAARKNPPQALLVQACGLPEVGDNLRRAVPPGHIPQELGRPGIKLLVGLCSQPLAVLRRVCSEARGAHISSFSMSPEVSQTRRQEPGPELPRDCLGRTTEWSRAILSARVGSG